MSQGKKPPPRHNLDHIAEPLRGLAVEVTSLTPDPQNARRHSAANLAAIEASLKRFGFIEPIVVQREGMIVRAGNGRLAVARRLKWTHIPAVVVDQADAEAAAFALADNRTSELAEWDQANLKAVLEQLHVSDPALLEVTGFDVDELLATTGPDTSPPLEAPEEFPEFDEETIETEYRCPSCNYEWSGRAK